MLWSALHSPVSLEGLTLNLARGEGGGTAPRPPGLSLCKGDQAQVSVPFYNFWRTGTGLLTHRQTSLRRRCVACMRPKPSISHTQADHRRRHTCPHRQARASPQLHARTGRQCPHHLHASQGTNLYHMRAPSRHGRHESITDVCVFLGMDGTMRIWIVKPLVVLTRKAVDFVLAGRP
jgi:hypothetical protein